MKENHRIVCICLILILPSILFSQKDTRIENKILILPDNSYKLFLNRSLMITDESCSEYYMITKFDDQKYQLKDSLKIFFTKNNNTYIEGNIIDGRLDGKFKQYFDDGNLNVVYEYSQGLRHGIWKTYNKQGQLNKFVFYKNGVGFLMDYYDEERNLLVDKGNGQFEGSIRLSPFGDDKFRLVGNVVNGLPDGEWNIYINGVKTGTEFFKNSQFEKGISYSKILGDSEYSDSFQTTFYGYMNVENLSFGNDYGCENKGIGLGSDFFERFNKKFYKQKLDNQIKNAWFLVDITTGKNRRISQVIILSNSSENEIDLIRNVVLKLKNPLSGSRLENYFRPEANFDFFPIVIKNGVPFNKFDMGDIQLLQPRVKVN